MTYINLQENEELFAKEARIINYMKCALLRNEGIESFYVDGIYVDVYESSNGYYLYFDNYEMNIEIYDKQIIGFKINAC